MEILKRRTLPSDLADRLDDLVGMFDVQVDKTPNNDELQALVSGMAGVFLEHGNWTHCEVVGESPFELDGSWREGFIVNALRP